MDFARLASLAGGYLEARVIQVALRLGLFDSLHGKKQDALTLATSIAADARATELLLNALTALGLLEKRGRLFCLNELSSTYLVRDAPRYFGAMILFDASLWECWGNLEKAVRTGRPVRAPDMFQADPQETERFIRAMDSLVRARGDADILTEALDFRGVQEMVDIGAGPGTYALYLCRKYPRLRATLFDLPGTIKVTERFVSASGLGDRIRLVAGDYRTDPIPGNYQLAFLSNIIHSESAEENSRLMRKVYSCLEQGGRIVIKDHILDDSLTQPPVGALFAVLMLLTTEKGRCYSFAEIRQWLEGAGYGRVGQTRLRAPLTSSLVIAVKPDSREI